MFCCFFVHLQNVNEPFLHISPKQFYEEPLFHHEDVTDEVIDEIENDLTEEDKTASKKSRSSRPRLNFIDMGMNKGSVLHWKEDPSITVEVFTEHSVLFNGEECVISRVTQKLKNSKWGMAPGNYWLYQNRLLSDIYDETYPFEE